MEREADKNRKEGKYVDFTIYAEGKPFPVHRLVLDAKSEYFKLLFSVDMKEKKKQSCELKEVTALGVERALDFLYGNDLVLENDTVEEVLKVCHMWQLSTAQKQCESFLIENLHVDDCITSRRLSNLYEMKELADKCTDFILAHLEDLKANLELDDLLVLLTTSAAKEICTEVLWNFCSDWGELRAEAGEQSVLCNLIKAFPVEKFEISKFEDVVWRGTHIAKCEGCKDHAVRNFVRAVQSKDIAVENCLSLKRLTKFPEKIPRKN